MPNTHGTRLLAKTLLTLIFFASVAHAERNNNFTITHKYAATADGYFNTPHLVKARAYWDDKKTVDLPDDATISVEDQVGITTGSQTADVFIPDNLEPGKPVGIYIHISPSGTANLPSRLETVFQDNYLIGASPDYAGNSLHDPERLARVLDLVTTLKNQYNIDESRVYVGGLSGGALMSIICGMLFPDTFTGIIATEHVMSESYWNRIFTREEMNEMAANGQRWSHILGRDSYAFWTLPGWATSWKYYFHSDSSVSPTRYNYDPFFDTYNIWVTGMAHTNPPPEAFEKSLRFVDAPSQCPRVKTYEDWEKYAFRLDDPGTVFYSWNSGETPRQAGDPTINHAPDDDFDGDGLKNWYEYLINTDPTIPNDAPTTPPLAIAGTEGVVHHRAGAMDQGFTMLSSTDLNSWDSTGAGVQAISSITEPGQTMTTTRFAPTAANPTTFFYRTALRYRPLVNLTQLASAAASQSTTGYNGLAQYAIDGNRDAYYFSYSTTHTDPTSLNWWKVDLGAEYDLLRIQFFNRKTYQHRLSNFRISILNDSGTEVVGKDYYLTKGHVSNSEIWDLPPGTRGRTVKVSMLGSNRAGDTVLSLAEFEVLGPDPAP